MKNNTDVNSTIIYHADDTFVFCSRKTISESKLHLKKCIGKLTLFFRKNELNVNGSSSRELLPFTFFSRTDGCAVLEKKVVKYLGVLIDCNPSSMKKKKCTKKNGFWHKSH